MSNIVGALPADHPVTTYAELALALGGSEDSFTGQLLHLIAKADPGNRAKLRKAFPWQVAAWEIWMERRCGHCGGVIVSWQMDGTISAAQLAAELTHVPDA